MKLLRRHKYAILALLVYWPALFIATHIQIPDYVRRSGVSDKTMHFLSYLGLTLFVWVTFQPFKKVNWLKWPVWVVIALIACYGTIDEISQQFVGRGTSAMDFAANMAGVFTSLIIMTFISFWPALLSVAAIMLYVLPNFSATNMICQNPMINAGFHFGGFAVFAIIWIQVFNRYFPLTHANAKWPTIAFLIPTIFLAVVKLTTALLGKSVYAVDFYIAAAGIFAVVIVSLPTGLFRYKLGQRKHDNDIYRW